MRSTIRPCATAAVAILGTSLIATTSGVAPVHEMGGARGARPDIALTATDAWADVFNTASANLTQLLNNYFLAPGVALQQLIANQAGYAQQILDDPSSNTLTAVNVQTQDNLAAVLSAPTLLNATQATMDAVSSHTLDASHNTLFAILPGYLPADEAATITAVVDFLASPLSAIILGGLGPVISPWVALSNSISDGDNFSDTLANMVGAFFNGADLNLESLLPLINGAGVFPPGLGLGELDIAFGGLLTAGSVAAGPYESFDSSGDVTASIPAVGGSIFNSIGLELTGVPVLGSLGAESQAIGPLGAWEGVAQTIAALLGWRGDGAPLAGVDLPIIPADSVDDGGVSDSVAAGSINWLQEFIAGLSG